MRLSSSRSFNPSQKLTQLVPFFEINSTVVFVLIILDTIHEVWKWNETVFIWGALQEILAALWSEECVSLIDEIGFEELALNMKVCMLNCQAKKRLMRLSKVSCIWRLNIGRLASTRRKKVTNLLCVGMVRCMWMRAITFGTNFGSAKCWMSPHQDRWQASLSELSDLYSYVPSTSPMEYHGP